MLLLRNAIFEVRKSPCGGRARAMQTQTSKNKTKKRRAIARAARGGCGGLGQLWEALAELGSNVGSNVGTKYLVPSMWYQVLGTKYLVPSTWYQVCGTKYSQVFPQNPVMPRVALCPWHS